MPELVGKPIQIVTIDSEHKASLNRSDLKRILTNKRVANKKIAIISVAGSFRKGKSFLLDFFLRYLNYERHENWLQDETEPLKGFSWRGGVTRETTGVWLWDEPFIVRRLTDGKELALFLMDTQGTFDNESTVRDNVTIFGLSALISSLQVYNLMVQIQEDDLQHLQLFTEYGMLVASGEQGSDPNAKPFQSLVVLVRDWKNFKDYPLGADGGQGYLQKVLEIKEHQHNDLKSVRTHIKTVFENISCVLLPHPGIEVVEDPDYDGKLTEVRATFKTNLKDVVEKVLSDESIPIKKINGEEVTCEEMYTFFDKYFEMFESDELPEPKTMLQVTGEANNASAKDQALRLFNEKMREFCEVASDPDVFKEMANQIRLESITSFEKKKKMGGPEIVKKYQDELNEQLDVAMKNYEELNRTKGKLRSIKTPLILCLLLLVTYILSYHWVDNILELLYLQRLIVPLDLSFWFILFVLLVYVATKALGRARGAVVIQRNIDGVANTVWDSGVGDAVTAVGGLVATKSAQAVLANAQSQ